MSQGLRIVVVSSLCLVYSVTFIDPNIHLFLQVYFQPICDSNAKIYRQNLLQSINLSGPHDKQKEKEQENTDEEEGKKKKPNDEEKNEKKEEEDEEEKEKEEEKQTISKEERENYNVPVAIDIDSSASSCNNQQSTEMSHASRHGGKQLSYISTW